MTDEEKQETHEFTVLDDLREARNAAAHGGSLPRERIVQLRAAVVGVGCKGSFVELASVRPR